MNKRHEAALKVKPIYAKGAQRVDDNEALVVKGIYLTWEKCLELGSIEHEEPGYKFTYNGELYKCVNPNPTFQADWIPSAIPAVYVRVDETHAGTINDPIPAVSGMEYEYGLYYLDPEDGNIYLCQRPGEPVGGKITLYALPHNLVGNYFELYLPEDKGYSGLLEED